MGHLLDSTADDPYMEPVEELGWYLLAVQACRVAVLADARNARLGCIEAWAHWVAVADVYDRTVSPVATCFDLA